MHKPWTASTRAALQPAFEGGPEHKLRASAATQLRGVSLEKDDPGPLSTRGQQATGTGHTQNNSKASQEVPINQEVPSNQEVPINQEDLLATSLAFSVVVLIGCER